MKANIRIFAAQGDGGLRNIAHDVRFAAADIDVTGDLARRHGKLLTRFISQFDDFLRAFAQALPIPKSK